VLQPTGTETSILDLHDARIRLQFCEALSNDKDVVPVKIIKEIAEKLLINNKIISVIT
jgi:hypothetical protein